jgi:acetyl esterase/lipase
MLHRLVFLLLFLLAATTVAQAQKQPEYIEIALWEKGLPNTNGKDNLPPNEKEHNFKPSIRVYLPAKDKATGRAVVACPGGSYNGLAYNHEGYGFAPFFTEQGVAFILLKYRMPFGHKEVPFSDAEEALRLVREHAREWNIKVEDIGIMGSSAGGHLASTIATHTKPELRPAFQILLYPVITMDSTYTHRGSRRNLLGSRPTADLIALYSNEKQVTKTTPRAFLALSDDDKVVSSVNGVNYYLALKQVGVPASLHVYPSGNHGWGIKDTFLYKEAFLTELRAWLKSF